MSKIRTSVVDKNGKPTHVWKNPDVPGGNKSFDRLGNVMTQFVPIAQEGSDSNFSGIIFSSDFATITSTDDKMAYLDVPELGALRDALNSFQWEGITADRSRFIPISKNTSAKFEGNTFTITDSRTGDIELNGDEASLLERNIGLYLQTARNEDGLTMTSGYANLIETPVSDREKNYYITLGPGALVAFDTFAAGLSDPDETAGDRDQVSFSRDADNPDVVHVQYSFTDDEFNVEAIVDNLDEDTYNAFRDKVQADLDEIDPRWVANFDSPDSLELLFNHNYEGAETDSDNRIEFTTSNALFDSHAELNVNWFEVWRSFSGNIEELSAQHG
jgi:hypothetical protein